ncbi:MAG: putative outer membrane protein [Caudoviricetes sp.]|nr:MAG: putative outer membrane protein [Caudoviricetes sp.]
MAIEFGPNGVCEYETNTYDNDGKSASIIDVVNNQRETLFFRGITAGDGITVNLVDTTYPNGLGYSTGKTIQINSTGGGSSSSVKVENAGATGQSIIGSAGVTNNTIPFKTIAVSNGLEISENSDIITISASSGLGAKWYVITTDTPDDSVGSDGDMLLDKDGEIFNKVSGKWTDSTVNIIGPKGDKGEVGATPTVTVGTTTTGEIGSNAQVSIDATSTANNVILDFVIPKGATGEAGTGLTNKGDWVSGTKYVSGDYVFSATSDTDSSTSMFIYKGDGSTESTVKPADDTTNWVEFTAPSGQRGSLWTVSTSTTAPTSISGAQINDQYLTGNGDIYTLTAIDTSGTQTWNKGSSLIGPKGNDGTDGKDGTNGKDGVSPTVTVGTTTTGDAGTNAQVSVNDTSTASNTILNFVIPKGATGDAGAAGTDGTKWFYNKTAIDGSTLKSEGGKVGDYCLISTGAIYTLTSIDTSGNEIWTDSGINITGPKGTNGTDGQNGTDGKNGATWYIGTIASPTTSTIPTDPILSGKTLNVNDVYLGQDLYVYTYNGTMWTKSTTYLGSTASGTTVNFDTTGQALGSLSDGTATIYSLTGGTGITLSQGSGQVTISTTGSSISSLVGSTTTTGITTLVQGDNVSFDVTTKGQLKISSTGGSGGSSTLQGLTDVSSVNPQTGNILQYNSGSSKWVATAPSFTLASNMSDVGITAATLADGQILTYRGVDKKWENVTLSVPVDNITGTLYVSKGGTGQTSFTTNGVVIGNGANGLNVTSAPTTAGTSLVWNGTSFEWDNNIGVDVQSNGTDQGTATTLNFTGTGVTTTTTSGKTTVNVSGSGASSKNVTFRLVFDNNSSNGATGNAVKVDSISDTSIISGTDQFTLNFDGAGGVKFKTLLDDTYISTNFIAMATNNKAVSWEQYPNVVGVTDTYSDSTLTVALNSFASPNVGGTQGSANNNTVAYISIDFAKLSGTLNPDPTI